METINNMIKSPMFKYILMVLTLILGSLQVLPAQSEEIEFTDEEISWISEHKTVRYGIDPTYPPFEFFDSNGNYRGIIPEYLKIISERSGIEFSIVSERSWDQLLEGTRNGSVDMLPGLNNTAERREFLNFTQSYISYPIVIFTRKDFPVINGFEDLKNDSVTLPKGYSEIQFLKENYPNIRIIETEDLSEALTKVATGQASATVGNLAVLSFLVQEKSLINLKVAAPTSGPESSLSMGTRKDWPLLSGILSKALSSITWEEHRNIRNKWVYLEQNPTQLRESIDLSPDEILWLNDHPVIKVHNEMDWTPFNFNESGVAKGFSIDYMNTIAKMLGISIEYVSGPSWDEFLTLIKNKDIDVMLNIAKTDEREEYLEFTEPYLSFAPAIYTRINSEPVNSIEDLYGKKFAIPDGFLYIDYFKDHPQVEQVLVQNTKGAVLAVSSGKADAMIDLMPVVNYFIDNLLITNLKSGGSLGIDDGAPIDVHIAVRSDWEILKSILDKAMIAVDSEIIQDIRNKWLGYEEDNILKTLSDEEIDFLKSHSVIRVHNEMDWAPFNFNRNERPIGYSIDYMNLLAEKLGIEIQYISGPSWNDFLGMIKNKELDVMLNIVKTEERLKYVLYTQPYIKNPNVIVSLASNGYSSIEELNDKTVAVVRGFYQEEILKRDFPDIELLLFNSTLDCLKAVSFGKAEAVLAETAVVNYIISENMLTSLVISGELILGDPDLPNLRIAVRDDWPLMQSALIKAMETVSVEEKNSINKKWLVQTGQNSIANPNNKSADGESDSGIMNSNLIHLLMIMIILIIIFIAVRIILKRSKRDTIVFNTKLMMNAGMVIMAFFIVIVSLLAWIALSRIKSAVISQIDASLNTSLSATDESLDLWIRENLEQLAEDAEDPGLVELTEIRLLDFQNRYVLEASENTIRIHRYFDSLVSKAGSRKYSILAPDLTVIATSGHMGFNSFSEIDQDRKTLFNLPFSGSPAFIPPMEFSQESTPLIFFTAPIKNKNGDVIALLSAQEDPGLEFSRLCSLGRFGTTGETYAFDKNGTLLSTSRFENELIEAGLLKRDEKSILNIELRNPGGEILNGFISETPRDLQQFTESVSQAINKRDGINLEGYEDYRGVPVLGIWKWNSRYNFGLVSEIDYFEGYKSYTSARNNIIIVLIITLIISISSIMLSIFIGDRATRALIKANDGLEERVESRTKELRFTQFGIDHAGESVLWIDPNTAMITHSNKRAWESLGYLKEEFKDMTVPQIDPQFPMEQWLLLVESLKEGNEAIFESVHRRKDGKTFPIEINATYIEYDDQSFIVAFVRDITDRKKAEEELRRATIIAEEATKAKGNFLANMSHEIRTPMNAIIGLDNLLSRTELTLKQKDYVSKIGRSAENLLGIINDILDFSKIEEGKMDIESTNFDLNDVLGNLFNMVGNKVLEKKLELIFNQDNNVPQNLIGDSLRLGQILLNLTNNAIKFTEKGEIEVATKVIHINDDETMIRFEVRDTGVGLTEEQISRLFKAFSQADSSTTRKYGGTGLGLSISKQLSELMGGEIGVESSYGEGSTFYFTAIFGIGEIDNRSKAPSDMKGLKVLVVDDNETSRDVLRSYLEDFSFTVTTVETGELAIRELVSTKAAENIDYDIILMDYQMPGMNGIEASLRIRNTLENMDEPKIIMVTSYGREDIMAQAKDVPLDGFLIKPVSPSMLLDTIMAAFGRSVASVERQIQGSDMPPGFDKIRGAQLLLVEDNEINQQVALETLSQEGFSVDIANNGKEAVEMIDSKYDAVLMDLQMPVMDGFKATNEIRNDERFKKLPIIAMTADAMVGIREKVLAKGMDDYITKPINLKELWQTLVKWIPPGDRKLPDGFLKNETDKLEKLFIPDISGINVKLGLSRVQGNKALYIKLLQSFMKNNINFKNNLSLALGESRIEDAVRIVHTLKGVGGNLGMEELFSMSEVFEKFLTDKNHDEQVIFKEADKLTIHFENILSSLKVYLDQHDESTELIENTLSIKELKESFIELEKRLSDSDLGSANSFEQLKPWINSEYSTDQAIELGDLIDDLDYDEALEYLIQMDVFSKLD